MNKKWRKPNNDCSKNWPVSTISFSSPKPPDRRRFPLRFMERERADLIAGMSDVKAAEGCRSPNRWRGAPRTEHGEAFGLRQSSAAVGSVAAKAKTAEDKGSPKRCVFRAAHRDHFRIQSSCASCTSSGPSVQTT